MPFQANETYMFCLCFLWKELFPLFFCNIVWFWVKRYCILRYYCLFIHSTLSYGTTAIICLYHQLIFARTYITSRDTKSPDSYHAITPVNVDICPPIISVEEKISSEKKAAQEFHLSYSQIAPCSKSHLFPSQ